MNDQTDVAGGFSFHPGALPGATIQLALYGEHTPVPAVNDADADLYIVFHGRSEMLQAGLHPASPLGEPVWSLHEADEIELGGRVAWVQVGLEQPFPLAAALPACRSDALALERQCARRGPGASK